MSDSTGRALLEDIRENPDDDTPRLVYADWLTEQDNEPRAELIRLQVRRARLAQGDKEAGRLLRREKALVKEHPEWVNLTESGITGELRRGFIEHLHTEPESLLASGAELFASHPIRSVTLRATDSHLSQLRQIAEQPWLSSLRALRVQKVSGAMSGLGDAGAEGLLRSPHLTSLKVLELYAGNCTSHTAGLIAALPHLQLTELELTYNQILAAGARALARAAHLANLTRLELGSTFISADGAVMLAESPHLRNLRVLNLSRTGIQVAGLRELVGSSILANVETLHLGRLRYAVRAAQLLARCKHLTNLRELNLNNNRLEDEGVAALCDSPTFTELRRLGLKSNRMSLIGVQTLAETTTWPNLQSLDLGRNDLDSVEKQQARQWFARGVAKF